MRSDHVSVVVIFSPLRLLGENSWCCTHLDLTDLHKSFGLMGSIAQLRGPVWACRVMKLLTIRLSHVHRFRSLSIRRFVGLALIHRVRFSYWRL